MFWSVRERDREEERKEFEGQRRRRRRFFDLPNDKNRFPSSYLFKHSVTVGTLLFLVPLVYDTRALGPAATAARREDFGGLFLLLSVSDAAHRL